MWSLPPGTVTAGGPVADRPRPGGRRSRHSGTCRRRTGRPIVPPFRLGGPGVPPDEPWTAIGRRRKKKKILPCRYAGSHGDGERRGPGADRPTDRPPGKIFFFSNRSDRRAVRRYGCRGRPRRASAGVEAWPKKKKIFANLTRGSHGDGDRRRPGRGR